MGGRVVRSQAARRDVLDIYLHIGRRSEPAAERFLAALERTCARLAALPGLGERAGTEALAAAGVRFMRVERFRNHLVLYRPIEGGIEVLRVLHGARDLPRGLGDVVE